VTKTRPNAECPAPWQADAGPCAGVRPCKPRLQGLTNPVLTDRGWSQSGTGGAIGAGSLPENGSRMSGWALKPTRGTSGPARAGQARHPRGALYGSSSVPLVFLYCTSSTRVLSSFGFEPFTHGIGTHWLRRLGLGHRSNPSPFCLSALEGKPQDGVIFGLQGDKVRASSNPSDFEAVPPFCIFFHNSC
jgi:hypothetical protein